MRPRSTNSITIKDVARLAGASVATVSGVINRKGTASAGMRRRVEAAMSALDYQPDILARGLKTGRSRVIGMLVPDVSNPFFIEAMSGVEETARSRGYSVILSNSNEDPAQEQANLGVLHSHRVDGVVLASVSGQAAFDRATRRRFPIVFIDRLPPGRFAGKAVIIDNADAGYRAARHLIGLGHTRIAVIAGHVELSLGRDRVAGFRRAMREARLTLRDSYHHEGDFLPANGYAAGRALFELAEPPTAIFSCGNGITLGLMRALTEAGKACPRDVSILSFDDVPMANYFHPQMSTVAQPAREMGREAMRILFAALEPDASEAKPARGNLTVLQAELRIRESTARPG
jgi:LacI family transcriptional regulator, galactose operon repressor